jgi:prepilin-type N-terminal cleavage/methylation domain-containing protein
MMIRPNKKVGFILPLPRERAFTLAELLIATGITAIMSSSSAHARFL